MAITYNAGTNIITVTGYTEGTPCTFLDIYNADVAGGWGVVTRQCTNQYCFDAQVYIGDGSTVTWFVDKYFHAIWNAFYTANYQYTLRGRLNSHIKLTYFSISVLESTYRVILGGVEGTPRSPDIKLEFGLFWAPYVIYSHRLQGWDGGYVKSCILINWGLSFLFDVDVEKVEINIDDQGTSLGFSTVTGGNIDDLVISQGSRPIVNFYGYGDTFKNVVLKNITAPEIWNEHLQSDFFYVNPDFEQWRFTWHSTAGPHTGVVYRQYEFDLKVIDKDENAINGIAVKVWDKDNNLVTNVTTGADGKITTQTLNYGYYNEAGGSTSVMQTPHIIQISASGYQTYKHKFTVDTKINWTIRLKHSNVCTDQEVMLA